MKFFKTIGLLSVFAAAVSLAAATVDERIDAIEKAIPALRSSDPLMSIWLGHQPGILRRLVSQIETDRANGNTERAASEAVDLEFLLKRVEKEVEWTRNQPKFDEKRINVRDLGAKADGVTDDTAAIQKAIEMADKGNIRTVYLPRGRYLVRHKPENLQKMPVGDICETWPPDHPSGAIQIQAKNIRIVGEDGTELLVNDPQSAALTIIGSENVRISDLKITYNPAVSVIGVITGVFPPDELEIQFDEGADPMAEYFHNRAFRGLLRFHAKDTFPGTIRPRYSNAVPHQGGAEFSPLGNRKYRVKCKQFLPLNKGYKPGLKVAYYARMWGDPAILNLLSSHTRLERIRLSDSPSIAFANIDVEMPLIAECSVKPEPGRWITTAADGFYLCSGFGGLFYRNLIENIGDDFLNIHGRMLPIIRREGNALFFSGRGWRESSLKKITRAAVTRFSLGENHIAAELPVKSIEILPPQSGSKWKTVKITLDGDPGPLTTVIDSGKPAKSDCLFFPEHEWQGLVFRGNDLRHGISRLLVGGRNMDITDNTIEDSLYNSCLFGFSTVSRNESHFPRNIRIESNKIHSQAKTVFDFQQFFKKTTGAKESKSFFNSEHILIANNQISLYSSWFLPVFRLQNADDLVVSGNVIKGSGAFSAPVFQCDAPLRATITGNRATGRFKGFVKKNDGAQVTESDNSLN